MVIPAKNQKTLQSYLASISALTLSQKAIKPDSNLKTQP